MSVRRIFVEKKPDYAVKAGELREFQKFTLEWAALPEKWCADISG